MQVLNALRKPSEGMVAILLITNQPFMQILQMLRHVSPFGKANSIVLFIVLGKNLKMDGINGLMNVP